jgi:exopolysaccharide biosynthesis protein
MLSLLRALNVQTALSLDGGSSTSMYADGRSLYSARASERPVSTALLVLDEPATSTTSTTTTTTTTLP